MEDPDTVVEYDFPPFLRQFKSGRVELYDSGADPAGTGVSSRDVVINPSTSLWARLFLPAGDDGVMRVRLPVVVYYHGGAFVVGSAAWRTTHVYLNRLAADANYRLAPEHPLPAAFDDSWEALEWVASHAAAGGDREDPWLAEHADLCRVFLGGASAGATIAHNMAARAGNGAGDAAHRLPRVDSTSAGSRRTGRRPPRSGGTGARARRGGTTRCATPSQRKAARVACGRVLVCVAGEDALRDRGVWYAEGLRASDYPGEVALHESAGVGHVFHYAHPDCDQARAMHARVLEFLRHQA
ncbi:hypothetical protein EJB05_22440, partial [Eragrostis curvula]